jgi:hypothetical protein
MRRTTRDQLRNVVEWENEARNGCKEYLTPYRSS